MRSLHIRRRANRWITGNHFPEKRPAGSPATLPEAGLSPLVLVSLSLKCVSLCAFFFLFFFPQHQDNDFTLVLDVGSPYPHSRTSTPTLQTKGDTTLRQAFTSSTAGAFCTTKRTAPTQFHPETFPGSDAGRVKQPVQISGISSGGLVCVYY